jgi:hypothetical protein
MAGLLGGESGAPDWNSKQRPSPPDYVFVDVGNIASSEGHCVGGSGGRCVSASIADARRWPS